MIRNINDPKGNPQTATIENQLGKSYDVVEAVEAKLPEIQLVADNIEAVKSAGANFSTAIAAADAAAISETNALASEQSASASAASATASKDAATLSASSASASATSAASSKTAAETAATNAAASQAAATSSATAADASKTAAASSASSAATSATNASNSANAAATSATNAGNSATAAQSAKTAAESARDATLTAYDSFDDRYLGAKASNPTTDNDGAALVVGALYFNSTVGEMRVWAGPSSGWLAAYVTSTGFASTNHTHFIPDVDGLQTALDGKAPASHNHDLLYYTEAEIDAKVADINTSIGTKLSAASYTASDVLAKILTVDTNSSGLNATTLQGSDPSAFAQASHSHTIANVTGLQSALDDKVATTNGTLTDPAIVGTILEDVFTITDGAAFEIDPGNGSIQIVTLGASRTPKATNFANGESITLAVDDGAAYTLTWTDTTFGASGVKWMGGTAPTLATTGLTWITLWKVGGQVYGSSPGASA